MTKSKRIILASTSPFRQKLLRDAGIPFEAIAPEDREHLIQDSNPKNLASKRALAKGFDVAQKLTEPSLVIGADQVLGFKGKSYDKAKTPDEAFLRLKEFQGQTHELYSAFCLVETDGTNPPKAILEQVVTCPMTMTALKDEEIWSYVNTGEWQGSVGCYRIEGLGGKFFKSLSSPIPAVIGMPMEELLQGLSGRF